MEKLPRFLECLQKKGGEIERTVEGKKVTLKRRLSTARWTFIIGKDGKIIYKDTSVKAAQDSENVIAFLKEYSKKKDA